MTEYSKADASPDAAPEPMSDEDVQSSLARMIEDAENFQEQVIAPQREEASKYYNGENFTEKQEGRSNVVMTELRDVVTSAMPSMMKVFWGPERRVEFLPTSKNDIGQAEQETDYISDIVMTVDNPGFIYTYMWFKDAFVKTTGVAKWWWDDTLSTVTDRIENATEEQLSLILAEDGVKLISKTEREETIEGQKVTLYDAEFTRTAEDGRARWMPLPPEEFGFNRGAKSIEEADLIYHHSLKTTTELLAMGISQDDIDEYGGKSSRLQDSPEKLQRDPSLSMPSDTETESPRGGDGFGPMDRHDYWETYPKLDANGDGKAELRKVCLLGPGKHVVENVAAPERPFALIVPDPEPHTLLGLSLFDYIADLQRISSFLFRGVLDSLSAHLNPRYEVVEDQVSIPDVLNHQLAAPIRVKAPNMVRPLDMPFVGAEALPVMEYVQGIRENRVGVLRAPGLDADALQSMEKGAAGAVVTAAQQRLELFARIFAETGFKQLMKGLRRLVIKHQPRARIVKMRGKYVEVDPRTWDADRDVTTNVALGLGFVEQKIQTLGVVAADQKDWLLKLGPTNPMVTLGQYRATMAKILKLQGYPNADEFYMPIPVDFQPPSAPQEQQPDPAMMVAQAEVAKTQAEMQKMQLDQQMKQQEAIAKAEEASAQRDHDLVIAQMEDERERAKLAAEIELKRYELELKYDAELRGHEVEADIEREKEHLKADTAREIAAIDAATQTNAAETQAKAAADAKASEKPAAPAPAPQVNIHVPEVKIPKPEVTVHMPETPKTKRRRTATARKNKDGSISIESEEKD